MSRVKNRPDQGPSTRLVAVGGLALGVAAMVSLVVFGLKYEIQTMGLSMLGVVVGSVAAARSKKHPGVTGIAFAGLALSGLSLAIVVLWMMAVSPEGSVAF